MIAPMIEAVRLRLCKGLATAASTRLYPGPANWVSTIGSKRSRDRVRGKEPAVKRSRLQDEIAGLAGVDVGKDVVVAEDQIVTLTATDVAHNAAERTRGNG
jgi:hypothetical protein